MEEDVRVARARLPGQPPVVEAHLKYLKPVRFDDELAVDTWVGLMTRARLRFDSRIYRGDTVVTEAKITLVCVELAGGRLRSIPDRVRAVCS